MRGRRLLGGGSITGAVLVAVAFFQASVHYRGFPQPTYDLVGIPLEEAGSQALYVAFALPFVALMVAGLHWLGVTMALERLLVRASRVPRLPVLLVLLVPLGAALTRLVVLKGQSVTDDEGVYLFIARTLLSGRVINPLPPDAEFFQNQFVVLNEHGWFGKYPVGQGLVLALGLVTRTVDVVQGLLGRLNDAVEHLERELISQGLERTKGNKSRLARELGISRSNLILKVQKYGLERPGAAASTEDDELGVPV